MAMFLEDEQISQKNLGLFQLQKENIKKLKSLRTEQRNLSRTQRRTWKNKRNTERLQDTENQKKSKLGSSTKKPSDQNNNEQ
ncbi:hypothetical protein SDJN02_14752 [Cucurbita argyrosperma subsp. argyrosperma]|nr:hypothetical protein SDJN02_14752 [Cucurbita argyrosperma subsp. argyrosperma]